MANSTNTNATLHALRNGFHSQTVLLPGDDPAQYHELLDELTNHFVVEPGDITALRYIREMADAEWRLRRARLHHEWLLTEKTAGLETAHPSLGPIQLQIRAHEQLAAESAYFRQILRFEEKFERQYERAYRGWTTYKKDTERAHHRNLDRAIKEILTAPIPASAPATPAPAKQNDTTEPNPTPETPRNAACPCGSAIKFKRCCGKSAPPVLGRAA